MAAVQFSSALLQTPSAQPSYYKPGLLAIARHAPDAEIRLTPLRDSTSLLPIGACRSLEQDEAQQRLAEKPRALRRLESADGLSLLALV